MQISLAKELRNSLFLALGISLNKGSEFLNFFAPEVGMQIFK